MSTPIAQYKLPSRIEIGFDSETKASIADLKAALDEVNKSLNARDGGFWFESKRRSKSKIGQIIADAIADEVKKMARPDGSLKTMQAEAANDSNGVSPHREPINDVDYLSESVPYVDEYDWASESVPQITKADMQLIFIKNLSECLIQRMHSMDRFSADDSTIGAVELMPWDIVIYEPLNAYAVLIDCRQRSRISDLLFFWDTGAAADSGWNTESGAFKELHTITEAELPAFRAALEACYA